MCNSRLANAPGTPPSRRINRGPISFFSSSLDPAPTSVQSSRPVERTSGRIDVTDSGSCDQENPHLEWCRFFCAPRTGTPSTVRHITQAVFFFFFKKKKFDTRTRTGKMEPFPHDKTDEVSMGNHDTVKELGSLVQQAQLRASVKSNRGSGNCAETRTQSFTSAVEKFLRDKPSTILHSEGTLPNHGQQPSTGICAHV